MITGEVIENGTLRIVLTANTEVGKAALKALQGARCTVITDNYRIFDKSVHDGLLIELVPEGAQQEANS